MQQYNNNKFNTYEEWRLSRINQLLEEVSNWSDQNRSKRYNLGKIKR